MQVKYIKDKDYEKSVMKEMQINDGLSNKEFEKTYKSVDKLLLQKIREYQEAWDKINDYFSEEIEKITRYKWKHQIYEVVLSPSLVGISNCGGNKVIRSMFEDAEDQKRITAHEMLMSHLWNIFYDKYPASKKEKKEKFWILNEITTTAILGLEPTINCLWTKKTQGFDQFLKNYPQMDNLKMELKEKYLNKKNFEDYLEKEIA